MPYAVNLTDWMAKQDDFCLKLLLKPVVQRQTIDCERGRWDGLALPLFCNEERAKAIAEIIRSQFHKNEFRIYCSKTGKGGWKRV